MSTAVVCGGRFYVASWRLAEVLEKVVREYQITCVVHGAASGADTAAAEWAAARGLAVFGIRAEWERYGRDAGPLRNKRLIETGPAVVVAFPGGPRTANLVQQAKRRGIPVVQVAA